MAILNKKKVESDHDVIEFGDQFEGNIESKTYIKINGEVIGEQVKAEKVVIGNSGTLKADIFTKLLILDGVLVGNVLQADRAILNQKGKLLGNINAKELITQEGVILQGHVKADPGIMEDINKEIPTLPSPPDQSPSSNNQDVNRKTDSQITGNDN